MLFDLRDLLADIELTNHPNLSFRTNYPRRDLITGIVRVPDDLWLQVVDDSLGKNGRGRKWRLSRHMTRAEVVQTALMAVIAFQEHEVRESFHYKGRAVFSPHFSMQALIEAVDVGRYEVRA